MRSVSFHPQAQQELFEAAEFYENRSVGLGRRFLDEVELGSVAIAEAPERCPVLSGTIRRYLVMPFPYGLLYTADSEHVVIVAVMHLHRKPGYWRDRIR
jgi:toxin ParE1/3/4